MDEHKLFIQRAIQEARLADAVHAALVHEQRIQTLVARHRREGLTEPQTGRPWFNKELRKLGIRHIEYVIAFKASLLK